MTSNLHIVFGIATWLLLELKKHSTGKWLSLKINTVPDSDYIIHTNWELVYFLQHFIPMGPKGVPSLDWVPPPSPPCTSGIILDLSVLSDLTPAVEIWPMSCCCCDLVGVKVPGLSHHQVKVAVIVDGGWHTHVVVLKLLLRDLWELQRTRK